MTKKNVFAPDFHTLEVFKNEGKKQSYRQLSETIT